VPIRIDRAIFNMPSPPPYMVTVQYRGPASALTDLISGQVQVMFDYPVSSIEHIMAGRLRAIAVTSAERFGALPDLPTVGEFVPGYTTDVWQGVGAPRDTPEEIIRRLNEEINTALVDPQIRARLADLGAVPFSMKPAQLGRFIADEVEKWANVIRAAGIKAD
jgi:tripartite-type tricarboxylate transporter receptor subunit TctC